MLKSCECAGVGEARGGYTDFLSIVVVSQLVIPVEKWKVGKGIEEGECVLSSNMPSM